MQLTAIIETGENGWLVGQIAEIPGVLSQGKSQEELIENLQDALELYLSVARESALYQNNTQTITLSF